MQVDQVCAPRVRVLLLAMASVLLAQLWLQQHVVASAREYHCGANSTYPHHSPPGLRIWNGEEARPGQLPFQALLVKSSGGLLCGGAIINEQYVATAAHCFFDNGRLRGAHEIGVRVGVIDKQDTLTGQNFDVAELKVHPEYDDSDLKTPHDVALIRIRGKISWRLNGGGSANKICLPNAGHHLGEALYASGWGQIESGAYLDVLRIARLKTTRCDEEYAELVCTECKEQKTTFHGDSGSPVFRYRNDGGVQYAELVGIVSFGYDCSEKPHKFAWHTNVYTHLTWIKRNSRQWK